MSFKEKGEAKPGGFKVWLTFMLYYDMVIMLWMNRWKLILKVIGVLGVDTNGWEEAKVFLSLAQSVELLIGIGPEGKEVLLNP